MTEEIRQSISTRHDEVNKAITTTDKQLVIVENKLGELNLSSDDEQNDSPPEMKATVMQRLREEYDALDASRKLLLELLARSKEESVAAAAQGGQGDPTTVNFGDNNQGFQGGIIHGGVSGLTFGGK